MKLADYGRKLGLKYQTVWKWYNEGRIPNAYKSPGGSILIKEEVSNIKPEYVVTYSRVSSSENVTNLNSQSQRLQDFCSAKGWIISENIKEIGSGINDSRKKFSKLLENPKVTKIIIEHKDRLTRFGFNYINILLKDRCEIIIINTTKNDKEDLIEDFVSIITSFTARIYGLRRCKRRTEKIIKELNFDKNTS